jgi:hypothetical protein
MNNLQSYGANWGGNQAKCAPIHAPFIPAPQCRHKLYLIEHTAYSDTNITEKRVAIPPTPSLPYVHRRALLPLTTGQIRGETLGFLRNNKGD